MPVQSSNISDVVDSVYRLSDRISVKNGPMVQGKPEGQKVSIVSDVSGDDAANLYKPETHEAARLVQEGIISIHLALFERAGIDPSNVTASSIGFSDSKTYHYIVGGKEIFQDELQEVLKHVAEEVQNMTPQERKNFDDRVGEIFDKSESERQKVIDTAPVAPTENPAFHMI